MAATSPREQAYSWAVPLLLPEAGSLRRTLNKADYQQHFLESKDSFDVIEVERFIFCNDSIACLLYAML